MSKILEIRDHKNNLYTVKTFYKDVEGLEGQLTSLKDELNLSITNNVNKVETSISEYVKDSISKNNTSLNNQIKDLKEEVENVSEIKDNIETIVEVPLGKYRINSGAGLTGGGLLTNNPAMSIKKVRLKSKFEKIVHAQRTTKTENVFYPNKVGENLGKVVVEVGSSARDLYGNILRLVIDLFSGEFSVMTSYGHVPSEYTDRGIVDKNLELPMYGEYSTLVNIGDIPVDNERNYDWGWFALRFYNDRVAIKSGGMIKDGDPNHLSFRVWCWG